MAHAACSCPFICLGTVLSSSLSLPFFLQDRLLAANGVSAEVQSLLVVPPPARLREYQLRAITSVIQGFTNGHARQLVALPTGAGMYAT